MFFRILYVIVSFSPFFFILGIVETLNILSITINGKEIAKVENLQYILIAIYFIIPIIAIIVMYRHLNRQQKKANGNRSTSPIKTKTIIQDREISKNFLLGVEPPGEFLERLSSKELCASAFHVVENEKERLKKEEERKDLIAYLKDATSK